MLPHIITHPGATVLDGELRVAADGDQRLLQVVRDDVREPVQLFVAPGDLPCAGNGRFMQRNTFERYRDQSSNTRGNPQVTVPEGVLRSRAGSAGCRASLRGC